MQYDLSIFKKDRLFITVGVAEVTGHTYINKLRATGLFQDGKPVFKENRKGAVSTFVLRDLEKNDMLLFDVTREKLPFQIDSEVKGEEVKENGLINLLGEKEEIKKWVMEKNINPFFTAFKKINHISYKREEALLFPEGLNN